MPLASGMTDIFKITGWHWKHDLSGHAEDLLLLVVMGTITPTPEKQSWEEEEMNSAQSNQENEFMTHEAPN